MPWPLVPLGEVAAFVRGVTFKPSDVSPTGVPVMRTKNVQATLDLSDVIRIGPHLVKRGEQYLRAGDILISSANSWNLVGKCCWVPQPEEPTAIGGFVTALRPGPAVDPGYLFRWFSSPLVQATVRSFGNQTTNISNLNLTRCRAMAFPLPPIEEQRRIADILDRADALRAKRRETLAHLDDLTQSIFLDMFGHPRSRQGGYETRSLSDVCHAYSGGTPSKTRQDFWEGELPWFSPKDLKRVELYGSLDHLAAAVPAETGLRVLPPDTVLMVVRGMILAHTVPTSLMMIPGTINQDLKALLPRQPIDPTFLVWAIRAQADSILASVSTAAHGTKRLDAAALAAITIPRPHPRVEVEFAARAKAVRGQLGIARSGQKSFEQLFVSLQQRAFAGEL